MPIVQPSKDGRDYLRVLAGDILPHEAQTHDLRWVAWYWGLIHSNATVSRNYLENVVAQGLSDPEFRDVIEPPEPSLPYEMYEEYITAGYDNEREINDDLPLADQIS